MRKLVLIVLLIFCGFIAQAQVEQNRFGIKLHTRFNVDREIGQAVNLNGIYPALQFRGSKGFLHHIDIAGISFGNSNLGSNNVRNFYLSAAYEFSIPLGLFTNNNELVSYLGLGLASSTSSYFLDPAFSNQFRQSYNIFVLGIYLLPNIQRDINERLFLDFALPITIGDLTITNSDISDPSLPIRQQNTTGVDREFFRFEQFSVRFGLGIRL